MPDGDLNGWDELSLTDLFYAFRKAKVDCFYESSIRVSEKFIEYEQNLPENLTNLLASLHAGEVSKILSEGMNDPIIFPKRLNITPETEKNVERHAFFSDADRTFKRISRKNLTPEFRLIGDFSVEAHVISALWINLIGHKFDARLSPRSLASRVRRYRSTKERNKIGHYHLEALGSFEPYFTPYRKWRDDGINTMKNSVTNGDSVVAITLDVGNFYHSIDPGFFVNSYFLDFIGLKLNPFEIEFCEQISDALRGWSDRCTAAMRSFGCEIHDTDIAGIPIGLSVVRVISNAVLTYLDEEIERGLSPIYYARYVDDLFLVIKDNQEIDSQEQLWRYITSKIPCFSQDAQGNVALKLPLWGGASDFKLQAAKQKTFFLSGRSGLDLLANIASQIREVSSERRLMPVAEQINTSQSAKALAASDTADEADSLRRADGLTLRRLGWSVLLRSINTLARDLRPKDWLKERNDFYDFAHEHVIRPDKILEQLDHLPRLFSLAVSLADWKQALKMYRETTASIYDLEKVTVGKPMKINGVHAQKVVPEVWEQTRSQVDTFFREALIRAYPVQDPKPIARAFLSLIKLLKIGEEELQTIALRSRESDWSRVPYREHLRLHAQRKPPQREGEEVLYGRYTYESLLRQFLGNSQLISDRRLKTRISVAAMSTPEKDASLLPFLFPTRPYTPEEIALYLPDDCVFKEPVAAAHNWAEYTRAVRGVWVRSKLAEESALHNSEDEESSEQPDLDEDLNSPSKRPPPSVVLIDQTPLKRPIKLGITSFSTTDETWAQAAAGSSDLSPARYEALSKIVNAAVKEAHKPDYLILPELSVPEQWISTMSGRLLDSGISLIAGLDYTRHPNNEIDSSAVLVLTDHRLGYPSSLQIRQRKEQPAPGEEEGLFVSHGQSWKVGQNEKKPIYVHNGIFFGVLVCSELQNIDYRSSFQGNVDCVMILSWNKDIETFSSLVDSASFDVHAYIALVNNLRYGDSRVRRPAKQSHLRDVCRVRGGLNNQLVVVEIDPTRLRAQQSRSKRWPKRNDAYKPAPEGFVISDARKCVPD